MTVSVVRKSDKKDMIASGNFNGNEGLRLFSIDRRMYSLLTYGAMRVYVYFPIDQSTAMDFQKRRVSDTRKELHNEFAYKRNR